MRSAILSLPFDQENNITANFLIENYDFDFLYSFNEIRRKKDLDRIIGLYKYDSIDKYLKHSSSSTFVFENLEEIADSRRNLLDIVSRWARTFGIEDRFLVVDNLTSRILEYWYDFILENQISVSIFGNIPHTPHDYAIYIIMKFLDKPTIFITPISNYVNNGLTLCFSFNMDLLYPFATNNQKNFIDKDLRPDLLQLKNRLYSENSSIKQAIFTDYKVKHQLFFMYKKILRLFRSGINFHRIIIKFRYELRFQLSKIIKSYLLIYLSKHKVDYTKYSDYYFFPLHYQPEDTTIPTAGVFRDQLMIIKLFSRLMPENTVLLVKEHPVYFPKVLKITRIKEPMTDYRTLNFYQAINNLKNVYLVDTFEDSIKIMRRSKGTLTISGSISLEAVKYSIPILLFGDHYYKYLPNVSYANSLVSIQNYLLKSKNENTLDLARIENYINGIGQQSVFTRLNKIRPILTHETAVNSGYYEMLNKLVSLYFNLVIS